ncbi:PAS domain S-box-containing protein [Pedobacter metabolipauper]|uniref:histidine kinase n=2 Tax=Pedobacter metabolipauper TaxID=425513 RepID=A0A4R6SYX3_9SPHI|nr:PAS domain S-box-containing protein [Pedobacter metabolipauper]
MDSPFDNRMLIEGNVSDQKLAVLLGELQIFQLELEMQNDELSASHLMLENERARFAGFFDLAPVGYFILDHLGIVEEANQTGADLLCISKNDILYKRFQALIDSAAWEIFYTFLHRMQTTSVKQNTEIRTYINGKELYIRMEGIAIQNAYTGKIQYYLTLIDVTENRMVQQRFMDTNQRLEMTLNASGTGTWTMGLGQNKVYLDDFCYTILGINPWDFDGSIKKLIEIVHPSDQLYVRQSLLNASNNSIEMDIEFRVVNRLGNVKTISAKGHEIHNDVDHSYFAGIIMDVTERKRLAKEAQDIQSEKQRLILSATFDAQEKERYKISSTLHDSVCQILYGIRMNLQNIQLSGKTEGNFANINELLDQAIRETRELSYELTPSVLRDFGFAAGVKEMAQRLSTATFKIKANIKSSAESISKDVQLYVFRMIQELINNCIKHAQATLAEITVSTKDGIVTLIVSDNGIGFDVNLEDSLFKGSGLRAIKNRIFLLNGHMDLTTSKKGTMVTLKLKSDFEPSLI